ncbi:nucleotidyltransferase family protein [Cellulomonas dongxiuzhuiae]|uniref:Nucleotidyltransferase family protein n=1 Tax=Cellulomonas dongxiuzhuiae TaxID=2819979 RepID=A0ABX8GHP9_9CELL|nr:nucleotidyltransferase family protein [Cellulomonas dongxiuzhuiae]MBO3088294.1 nucleotidyltransferase family protein [Cellulomonas dongxiuzhuiae]MBO3094374.1 nucleotidyltransferase family protein [Cellulomonas dongxiuzhuiae]QWC15407.1 nucleotidyltransferase family protein [Cellulomonas dongxiuzhuiae]
MHNPTTTPLTGAAPPPLPAPTGAETPDDRAALQDGLRRTAVALLDAEIPFALVGGYAAWARGAPEPSHDADFAVAEDDVDAARAALAAAGLDVQQPAENWLFKAYHHGQLIDVIFRMVGEPVTREQLAQADQLEVLAVRMPVLPATDIISAKMRVLGEHYCDFTWLLPMARALREQIDWDRVREEIDGQPYARAFMFLADELGLTGHPGDRLTAAPGRSDPGTEE